MSQAQLLDEPAREADLSVDTADYFGRPLDDFANVSGYPFREGDGPLKRHSYVFQALYKIGSGDNSKYGGIQLRARIATYGDISRKIRDRMEWIAHRAAGIYDSTIESAVYDGYLTGFNVFDLYHNWESEPVTVSETAQIGVVDWSTEVYTDDSFDNAYLSGIAQGVANPYRVETVHEPGEPPVDVPPTKWVIGWEQSRRDGEGEYYVRPQPDTRASDRYRDGAGHGKRVHVNGKPIGTLGPKGRVWLSPEYGRGDPNVSKGSWGTYWSREGLVDETGATYQAIRKGGVMYQTGETEDAVYLSTAREKPDDWRGADPDDVPVDLQAHAGREGRTVYLLRLVDEGAEIPVEARRDEEIIKHLGYSSPTYRHRLREGDEWRPVDQGGPR